MKNTPVTEVGFSIENCADFRRNVVERCLYPTRRIGRLAFLFLLWIVLTFRSSHTWRTGGAMLSFICLMAILLTAASLIPGATSLQLSSRLLLRYGSQHTKHDAIGHFIASVQKRLGVAAPSAAPSAQPFKVSEGFNDALTR